MTSERDTILDALKDELVKIHPGDANYTSSIGEVRRGYYGFNDAINKPLVCINMLSDDVSEEYMGSGQIRTMGVKIYCLMDTDGINRYGKVHTLLRDLEYFLKHDFSFSNSVYVNRIHLSEGGLLFPETWFSINIKVIYNQSL